MVDDTVFPEVEKLRKTIIKQVLLCALHSVFYLWFFFRFFTCHSVPAA